MLNSNARVSSIQVEQPLAPLKFKGSYNTFENQWKL